MKVDIRASSFLAASAEPANSTSVSEQARLKGLWYGTKKVFTAAEFVLDGLPIIPDFDKKRMRDSRSCLDPRVAW